MSVDKNVQKVIIYKNTYKECICKFNQDIIVSDSLFMQ